ncbi:MAG TPA: molybdopterin cofactor-binding domain-containing protein [Ferrovibrio sp.]|uniref:xanthine dehydrogenase family protein molybdopterin-binding subunit n=1 Tax=Ferrovibrio sp. TaxID=1917215 RepID=UPI002ED67196
MPPIAPRFPPVRRRLALTRREALRGAALSAGGLLIGLQLPAKAARGQNAVNMPLVARLNAWLHIGRDDRITFLLDRSEMGQGAHTGLATLIAEELDVDPMQVTIRNAPADKAYRNVYLVKSMLTGGKAERLSGLPLWAVERLGRLVGQQVTGGSTSIRGGFEPMRRAGAEARFRLVQAAAARWQVPADECTTAAGIVTHEPSGQSLSYGAVADAAAQIEPPDKIPLRPRSAWRLIGKHDQRVDTEAKVTGKAVFGLDVRQPDQLFAAMQWAPHFGAKLKSLESAEALKRPGIKAVVPLADGFAVVADNSWRAMQARSAVTAEWTPGPESGFDDAALWRRLHDAIDGEGKLAHKTGDVDKALGGAAKIVSAEYRLPFLAHATMEPMNATALVGPDGVDVWAPTQAQEAVQQAAAKAIGVSEDRVRVHTTYLGGGFGRRSEADFVAAAAQVAKAVTGRPVQVMWPREEDMRHDFYRPAALHRIKTGLDGAGRPIAWKQDLASPSIMRRVFPPTTWLGPDETSIEGSLDGVYGIPNAALEYVAAETPVPVGFWRSVGHSHNAFVKECMIDEAAHAAGQDPFAYRRALLAGSPRHLAVLELAAARAGWGTPLAAGKGRGIALHESFGTIVAMVAEISVDDGRIKPDRIVCAADAGTVINPAIAVAQLSGGAIFGLTAALYGRVTLQNGAVQEGNFDTYQMLHMADAPRVDVHLIGSEAAPGGLGEPGVPPAAPALANAVFAATGERLRNLPLSLTGHRA